MRSVYLRRGPAPMPSEPTALLPRSLLRVLLISTAVLLGLLQAWTARNTLDTDGLSYLELGERLVSGSWLHAVNAYWSPLYPLLLGLALHIFHPAPPMENAVLHLVNFAVYLSALACFDFFLRQLIRHCGGGEKAAWLSPRGFLLLGYTLFVWSSLELITLKVISPDLLQSGLFYLAFALLLRMRGAPIRAADSAVFGAVLGLAYFAKAPAFLLAFVFLGAMLFQSWRVAHAARGAALAFSVFAAMAALLIIPLSRDRGGFTFGESGRINYAWYVNGLAYRHWQGGEGKDGAGGVPLHPTRKILQDPPVYEFASPVPGTYPVWADPSYWYEGVRIRPDVRQQATRFTSNLKQLYGHFLNLHAPALWREGREARLISPVLVFLVVVLLPWAALRAGRGFGGLAADLAREAVLIVPAAAALLMYSLIWVEPRFLAVHFVVLLLGLAAGCRRPAAHSCPRYLAAFPAAAAILCGFLLMASQWRALAAPNLSADTRSDRRVAAAVGALGVRSAAVLEYANHGHFRWARLARVRIIAELYTDAFRLDDEQTFWRAGGTDQSRVMQAFAQAGADAIVSRTPPSGPLANCWTAAGPYFACLLKPRWHGGGAVPCATPLTGNQPGTPAGP
jgi:hypothetical protein